MTDPSSRALWNARTRPDTSRAALRGLGGTAGTRMKTSAVAWTPTSHARLFQKIQVCLFFDKIKFPCESMFRVLPPASPPPFVVSRFGGEELLPGTLDTMRGS